MALAGSYVSDPSNVANVSTSGKNLAEGSAWGLGGSGPPNLGHRPSLAAPRPGLEVYPSRTQLPGLLPQPVLAGVVGGVCFLGVAVLVSVLAACLTNRRRAARRRRKRLRQGRPPRPRPPGERPSLPGQVHSSRPRLCLGSGDLHCSQPDGVGRQVSGGGSVPGVLESLVTSGSPAHTDPPLTFSPPGKSAPQ